MFIVEIPQCTDILEMVLDFNIHCDLTTFYNIIACFFGYGWLALEICNSLHVLCSGDGCVLH